MTRSVCHVATTADDGRRIDVVLSDAQIYKSRSAAAKAIDLGHVYVFGNVVSKSEKVSAGDVIVCELEDESIFELAPEPIDLDIRYDDDDVIVLSKQAGLITHPNDDFQSGTLVNALLWHFGAENLCNVQGEDDRPGIVHRLDGDTSGLMLAAKTDDAGQFLMSEIALKNVNRRYIALVHGIISPDTGMIDAPIERCKKDRTKMAVGDGASSRDAITTFSVLERFEEAKGDVGYTLVECKLYTGRTHQIRVHMQYIKHPIVGDQTYTSGAPKSLNASLGLTRQFLHSHEISFTHPKNGEVLHFIDMLPADLQDALDQIKDRSLGRTEYGKSVFAAKEEML